MDILTFNKIVETINLKIKSPLPAETAHTKLIPKELLTKYKNNVTSEKKESSVMLMIFDSDNPKIVFILRNKYDGAHSGQISFPGGQKDEGDINLLETAIRETAEEIGIKVNKSNILGKLSDIYIYPSNFLVSPYICVIEKDLIFSKQNDEVADIITIPIIELLKQKDKKIFKDVSTYKDGNLHVPGFFYNGTFIWGATAMILQEFLELIDGE